MSGKGEVDVLPLTGDVIHIDRLDYKVISVRTTTSGGNEEVAITTPEVDIELIPPSLQHWRAYLAIVAFGCSTIFAVVYTYLVLMGIGIGGVRDTSGLQVFGMVLLGPPCFPLPIWILAAVVCFRAIKRSSLDK